jgi:ribulose-bisphosphate carboxylase large chain
MVDARNRAEDNSGEKKFYIANLLCEPADLAERADIVESLSADAVLVAPAVQGLGVLRWVRSLTQLPILAHNTFSEMFTRHPSWRIDPAVYVRMQRALGADWIVTPGAFGNPDVDEDELVDAARAVNEPLGKCAPCMPIVQGGKRPAGLSDYIGAVGGLDFMLIVASWVDGHPDGLTSACMKFREAVDAL